MACIVVAEDDQASRELAIQVLHGEGHFPIPAIDGQEALELIQRAEPPLLLLDVMMPLRDGFDVLREMKRSGASMKTRVLMLTARGEDRDWARAFQLGADYYLTKPLELTDLISAVRFLLTADGKEIERHREDELARSVVLSRLDATIDRP